MFKKIKELLFVNTSVKQTVIKNSVWLTLSIAIGRLIRALVIIYAARVLGTEGYGIFSYAMSIAAFFSIFSDVGLTGLLTREISKDPEKKENYVSTIFSIKIAVLIATLLITIFISPYFVKIKEVGPLIPLAAFLVLFDNLRLFGFGFARARQKMEKEGLLSISTDIFITALSLVALFFFPSPLNLSFMYVFGSCAGTVLVFIVLRKYILQSYGKFDIKLVKPILSVAIPFAVMGVFSALMINIDMVILGIYKNAQELGLYSAAQRPVQFLYIIPTILATSVFPLLSRFAHTNEEDKTKLILTKSITSMLMLALPMFVGGIIVSDQIIEIAFGTEYLPSLISFQLLLFTILLVFPGTIIGNTLFSYDLQKKLMIATGLGAFLNTALDFILIPRFGINGSAIATVFVQIVTNGMCWYFLKQRIGFKMKTNFVPLFLSLICMGIFSYVFREFGVNVIINIFLSGIIYIGALFIFKDPLIKEVVELGLRFRKNKKTLTSE